MKCHGGLDKNLNRPFSLYICLKCIYLIQVFKNVLLNIKNSLKKTTHDVNNQIFVNINFKLRCNLKYEYCHGGLIQTTYDARYVVVLGALSYIIFFKKDVNKKAHKSDRHPESIQKHKLTKTRRLKICAKTDMRSRGRFEVRLSQVIVKLKAYTKT